MPRRPGSHLTYEERCHIYAYIRSGKSLRSIGNLLGCSHTTIIREVKRNGGKRGYRGHQAHSFAEARRHHASSKGSKMTLEMQALIQSMLEETQASPEQIAGRLALTHDIRISHESIYKHIWKDKLSGGTLYLHLRRAGKKYNKRSEKNAGRGLIPNRRDISERPPIVEDKSRFGDFEADTIVGARHQGAIVSSVDRASKYTILDLVDRATAENIRDSLDRSFTSLAKKDYLHTITADNGKEFAQHVQIAENLGIDFFFARPYRACDRGLNEHTNGLVRQYFPKGTDFRTLKKEEVLNVARKLNARPRKILNFQTPHEVFLKLTRSHHHNGALHT